MNLIILPACLSSRKDQPKSRTGVTCCRNGQKVVDIRKAPPIGDTDDNVADDEKYGGEMDTPSAGIQDIPSEHSSNDVEGSGSEEGESSGGMHEPLPKKNKKRGSGSGRGKKKRGLKRRAGGEKRIHSSDDDEPPQKKWKTDGNTAVVHPAAETFIFRLATVNGQQQNQDFLSFLHQICPSSSQSFQSPVQNVNSTFALLVAQCQTRQTDSTVADFSHMVSLILLALYIDR